MALTTITLPDSSLVYHHSALTVPSTSQDLAKLNEQNIARTATALNSVSASVNSSAATYRLSTLIAAPAASGAIPVTVSGHVELVTATAETRTLAAPTFVGQQLLISLKTDGGDCVITCATTVNQTGNNTITLDDAGDAVLLIGKQNGSNIRWSVMMNDGATLTTV